VNRTPGSRKKATVGVVNVRELAREPSKVIDEVEQGTTFLLTRRGVPVATVTPIDQDALESFILANAPEFVASMREADAALAAGETVSLSEYLIERGAD
jgi:prevent-host-death family protein